MLGWMTQNNDTTIFSSVEMFVRQFAIRVELYLISKIIPKYKHVYMCCVQNVHDILLKYKSRTEWLIQINLFPFDCEHRTPAHLERLISWRQTELWIY